MKISNIQAHFLTLLTTIIVTGSFLASEKLAKIISPVSLTLLRFLCATLILLPIILINKNWGSKVIKTIPRAMGISFFYSLYLLVFFESLKTTTSLNTGTLFTLAPLITAIIYGLIFKEKQNKKELLIFLLGIIGTLWVIFKGQIDLLLSLSMNQGDLIFTVGLIFMCLYSISIKLLYKNDEMIVLVFCILLGGTLWMALAILILRDPLKWNLIKGESIFHMAYLVIFATLLLSYLYQKTTVILGPKKVMSYIYINPASVAVLLFILDGIKIQNKVIPGIIISSIATILLQKDQKNK